MVFKGTPGMLVKDVNKNKRYYFDKNGELETEEPRLIRKLSVHFEAKQAQKFACSNCGKTCKSQLGLQSHLRGCRGE